MNLQSALSGLPLAASAALVLRAYPFLLLRTAVYLGLAAALSVATLGGAGLGWLLGGVAGAGARSAGAWWGALAGFAAVGLMVWWLREYVLYLVKAAHVAALIDTLDGRPPPPGQGRIAHALDTVQRRFRGIDNVFAIDRALRRVLPSALGLGELRASLPWGDQVPEAVIEGLARPVIGLAAEAVLAGPMREAGDPWARTRDAVVLFAQSRKRARAVVMAVALLLYGAAAVAFLIALVPAAALGQAVPGAAAEIALLLALGFAWALMRALIEPVALAALILSLHRTIEGLTPDPAQAERLAGASDAFRAIDARAGGSRTPRRGRQV